MFQVMIKVTDQESVEQIVRYADVSAVVCMPVSTVVCTVMMNTFKKFKNALRDKFIFPYFQTITVLFQILKADFNLW
jgi:hypothetical protein